MNFLNGGGLYDMPQGDEMARRQRLIQMRQQAAMPMPMQPNDMRQPTAEPVNGFTRTPLDFSNSAPVNLPNNQTPFQFAPQQQMQSAEQVAPGLLGANTPQGGQVFGGYPADEDGAKMAAAKADEGASRVPMVQVTPMGGRYQRRYKGLLA